MVKTSSDMNMREQIFFLEQLFLYSYGQANPNWKSLTSEKSSHLMREKNNIKVSLPQKVSQKLLSC